MSYKLLPINFERLEQEYFVTNIVGEHIYLPREIFLHFINKTLSHKNEYYLDLKAKHMLADGQIDDVLNMLAIKFRTKKNFLSDFTSLHMVVPTLSCNSNCVYCQVSSKDINEQKYYMQKSTAKKIVETIFKSPSNFIKIEFQGGEPLLNYDIVKYIINYSERLNLLFKKHLQFVLCTNLMLIDAAKLRFLKEHRVFISTSLDGPKEIHNANRPLRNSDASYDQLIEKIKLARGILGPHSISALMTVTKLSLGKMQNIVDEYLGQGFHSLFIRPLNPYGLATKRLQNLEYSPQEFFQAYKNALKYIIEQNMKGNYIVEEFTYLLLKRILTPFATGFVDFQSPAGVGVSGAIYDYDGNVYVSDEGRMLAAMGDRKFLMGNVNVDEYEDMFNGEFLISLLDKSCLESLPICSSCAYGPFCAADPVRNYAEQGDIIGNKMLSYTCQKNKLIFKYLAELVRKGGDDVLDVFWSWLTQRSLSETKIG
jgi:uncharacterized protein